MRWALLGTPLSIPALALSAAIALLLCATGLVFFTRMERRFADVV
jgi:ABC-type polysaccharide/polyol phosphate export permease